MLACAAVSALMIAIIIMMSTAAMFVFVIYFAGIVSMSVTGSSVSHVPFHM